MEVPLATRQLYLWIVKSDDWRGGFSVEKINCEVHVVQKLATRHKMVSALRYLLILSLGHKLISQLSDERKCSEIH